jgi:Transposase DDE domain
MYWKSLDQGFQYEPVLPNLPKLAMRVGCRFHLPWRVIMQASLFKDPIFRAFAEQCPFATITQMVLHRILDSKSINQLFHDHAGEQYHRSLLFSTLTRLVSNVVLSKYASVNAGYKKMKNELNVSITAVYEKLQRVEPALVQQLVRYSYQQTVEICNEIGCVPRNDLPGYTTKILDGNSLAGTDHRLIETRTSTAAPLPGRSLVVFEPRYNAVSDFFPIEDAYSQERSELDAVIATFLSNQLWIADRNFCTLKFLYSIAAKSGSAFVIRFHNQIQGGIEKGKLRKVGTSETGTIYENKLVLPAFGGVQITVRRIVVQLSKPTRDKDTEIVLLSNLPEKDADGIVVSQLYRQRWKIESAFGHMTLTMNCEIKTLCYPKAGLFCFGSALMAYNAFAITKGALAAERGREESNMLSHYYVALEISESTRGMLVVLPEARWDSMQAISNKDFAAQVCKIIGRIDLSPYRKSIRGPKKPPPVRSNIKTSVHVSTKRILDKRKENSY